MLTLMNRPATVPQYSGGAKRVSRMPALNLLNKRSGIKKPRLTIAIQQFRRDRTAQQHSILRGESERLGDR
jgi:hypothetical protein